MNREQGENQTTSPLPTCRNVLDSYPTLAASSLCRRTQADRNKGNGTPKAGKPELLLLQRLSAETTSTCIPVIKIIPTPKQFALTDSFSSACSESEQICECLRFDFPSQENRPKENKSKVSRSSCVSPLQIIFPTSHVQTLLVSKDLHPHLFCLPFLSLTSL